MDQKKNNKKNNGDKDNLKEYIRNPQRAVLRRWLLADMFFIFLGIDSFIDFDINSFDGMFIMLSLSVVLTSLFFIRAAMKNIRVLDDAIKRGKKIIHWRYTKKEWSDYLVHEKNYRKGSGLVMATALSVMTAAVFILFILFIQEGRLFMFLVMLCLFALYFFMGFVFPSIVFYIRKRRTGDVILLEKGVLLDKQFHTWDFPLSRFRSARFSREPYEHLKITYSFVDRTGPRDYTINVPVPRQNKADVDNIISKFR